MKSFHRSRGLRAIAAFLLVLASSGAETAHGAAHSAEIHAAEDAHSHETAESSVSGGPDKDHGHERVANGMVVRSAQWVVMATPAQPDFHGLLLDVRTTVAEFTGHTLWSIATGPPPRLRAPPVN